MVIRLFGGVGGAYSSRYLRLITSVFILPFPAPEPLFRKPRDFYGWLTQKVKLGFSQPLSILLSRQKPARIVEYDFGLRLAPRPFGR